MKKTIRLILAVLVLSGCAGAPPSERTFCSERIDLPGILMYADSYDGKTTGNCDGWCIGRGPEVRCGCKETCRCKRPR